MNYTEPLHYVKGSLITDCARYHA